MAAPQEQPDAGSRLPLVAVLLTWFLPGAGHLYLGRVKTAAIAFVAIEGLFLLGLSLSEARTFEFLDPELRSPAAILLAPEVGNLGGLLWQLQQVPMRTMPFHPGALPQAIHLGSLLAVLSGLANLALMSHAHYVARGVQRREGVSPAVHCAAGWAIPGLGHWLQGRRARGVLLFAVLVGLFVLGTVFSESSNLSRERHFYYWTAQVFLGLPAIGAELLSGRPPVTGPIPRVDLGLFYAALAGLLNLIALIDVYGYQAARLADQDPVEERHPKHAPSEPAKPADKHLVGAAASQEASS